MKKDDYIDFANKFFRTCLETTKKKNEDYTGKSDDALANFRSVELYNIPAEVGLLTRMQDKMMRIGSYITKGKLEVSDESVTDTLMDLANYSMLLAAYIEDKKQ